MLPTHQTYRGNGQSFYKENTFPLSDESLDIPSTPSYTTQVPTSYDEVDGDVVHAIRIDHEEDISEN